MWCPSKYRFKNPDLFPPAVMPCTKKHHDMLSHSEISEVLEKTLEVVVMEYCWSAVLSLLLWLLRCARTGGSSTAPGTNSSRAETPPQIRIQCRPLHTMRVLYLIAGKKNYSHFASLYFCIMNNTSFVHVMLGRGDVKQP